MLTSKAEESKPDSDQIEADLHNARVLVDILWDAIENGGGKTRSIVLLDEIDRHLRSIEEEIRGSGGEAQAGDKAEVRQ